LHNVILCHLAPFEFYFKFIEVFSQKIFYLKICIEIKIGPKLVVLGQK